MTPIDLIWIFIILSTFQPMLQQRVLAARRTSALRALERRRGSRAIEMTGKEVPVDLVLHTPGDLVLAAEQIAAALADHPAPVTVRAHYAMSGGTIIASAADQIVMSPSAVLGPVDPQVGEYPAASVCAAVERKDPNETDDKTLIIADISRKAQRQVRHFVKELLCKQFSVERAAELATTLGEGRWTHDFHRWGTSRFHMTHRGHPGIRSVARGVRGHDGLPGTAAFAGRRTAAGAAGKPE